MSQTISNIAVGVMLTVVLGLGTVGAFRWTLIPFAIDGRVDSVGSVDGTAADGPAHHLRTLEVGDESFVVSRSLVTGVGGDKAIRGATLRKDRWQTTLQINGEPVALAVPEEFWRTIVALLIPIAAGITARAAIRSRSIR